VVREDGTSCEPDEQGSLLVRGPGRMRGYLDDPRTTAEVLHEGWFDTGDVGALDRDGFLLVVDRRERFTRVAGVRVAHARVEDALRSVLPSTDGRLAVVSGVGDGAPPLVVVHTRLSVAAERLREAALATGLPPASVPPVETWVEVDTLPLQSSGKLDLMALARLARAATPARPT
jgi:acyl-[acyl-carrier-protein]-phospholipid O-acyltransferase/long-chain-fatty-acid--[acyl-carrier-protein] ligase